MLVLARRPSQSIVFPELGITIQVVETSNSVARIGVHAPREIKILRDEVYNKIIADDPDAFDSQTALEKEKRERHDLKNRLNAANIAIHLARRHLQEDRAKEAQAALDRAIGELRNLNYIMKTQGQSTVRVLLVEDDSNERELLAAYLRSSGFEVSTAADGNAAIEFLSNEIKPDVVLLDMLMPNFNGQETIEAIRETPHLDGLKVFAVSGTDPSDLDVSIGARGVDGWFEKPLNPEQLVRALQGQPATTAVV